MKAGTAAGPDGAPPEIYKALPFNVLLHIWKLFAARQRDHSSFDPPSWKLIDYVAIPKVQKAIGLESIVGYQIWTAC